MARTQTYSVTGTAFWCKLLGEPRENMNGDPVWTLDVALDEENSNKLKRLGLDKKIKNKDDNRGDFITFERRFEKKRPDKKGRTENKPVPVFDGTGGQRVKSAPEIIIGNDDTVRVKWDPEVTIGNGSIVRVKFSLFDVPPMPKFKYAGGVKPVIYEVTVLKHVEYVPVDRDDDDESEAAKPDANGKEQWNN